MAELRRVPLHQALTRPQLLAGGEREPMLIMAIICFTLVFVGLSWFTFVGALILYFMGTIGLRQLAKSDPMMTHIYLRHIRYQRFLGARPTLLAQPRKIKSWS